MQLLLTIASTQLAGIADQADAAELELLQLAELAWQAIAAQQQHGALRPNWSAFASSPEALSFLDSSGAACTV